VPTISAPYLAVVLVPEPISLISGENDQLPTWIQNNIRNFFINILPDLFEASFYAGDSGDSRSPKPTHSGKGS